MDGLDLDCDHQFIESIVPMDETDIQFELGIGS
jgi:hypothetical protein